MIEVIKRGNHTMRKATMYKINCNNCGCIFQCNWLDFERIDMRNNGKFFIHCPDCNSFLGLRPQDMIVIEVE